MKSLALGVRFIISRTTPTALAVEMAEDAGICLVGYMRANQFEVYSHSEYLN
jgi:FdhD protein